MEDKIDIVHFHNGKAGGVWSVIKNLISFSRNPVIKHHVIIYHVRNEKISCNPQELPDHVNLNYLTYETADNFNYTCKALAELVPNNKSVIIAHDWLELGMCSHLGLANPLVYYMHGDYDYYYSLFEKHKEVIDETITVSNSMKEKLVGRFPIFRDHINYIRFPVPPAASVKSKRRKSIVFVGRLEEGKGFDLVLMIADMLKPDREIEWHIVGESTRDWRSELPEGSNFTMYGSLPNEKVGELLSEMEILLLPSTHEGMPIAVIEAMKSGVVPLVSDIPGGIQELIVDGKTGFKLDRRQLNEWCAKVKLLQSRGDLMALMSSSAREVASQMFEPVKNVKLFEDYLAILAKRTPQQNKVKKAVYGSRLDKPWIPNSIVRLIRK